MTNPPNVLPCLCGAVPRLVDFAGWEILCTCGISFCLHENPTLEATVIAWNKLHTRAIDRDEVLGWLDDVARVAKNLGYAEKESGRNTEIYAELSDRLEQHKSALLAYIVIKE